MSDISDLAVDAVGCWYCGVPEGTPCRTASGRKASAHVARLHPVLAGWRKGYDAGLRDAVDEPDWAADVIDRRDNKAGA